MLISGKGKCFHVFGCISKNFPENIFWCLEKKNENTNQKTQATTQKKKNHQFQKCFQSDDRAVIAIRDRDRRRDRDHGAISAQSRFGSRSRRDGDPRSRSRLLRKIAIATSPSDWSWSSQSRTGSSPLARARALSLSLSLIFRKCFEGKIEV